MSGEPICTHDELQFGSGGFYVFCSQCQAAWVALEKGFINDGKIDVHAGNRSPGRDPTCGTFKWTPRALAHQTAEERDNG